MQIKQRIKAIESNSKIASSIIPILALAYAAIVVYLIGSKKPGIFFDVTFFLNASSYLLGVSPLAVIMFGYLVESTKQRLIMPLEECLTIIEGYQRKAGQLPRAGQAKTPRESLE